MSVFDLSKIPPMNWTGALCLECGRRRHRSEVEDGWCSRCRGVQPAPIVVTVPELQPKTWTLEACETPGMARWNGEPMTFTAAVRMSSMFGGRVRPIKEARSA